MVYDNQVPIWVILSKKEVEDVIEFCKKVQHNNRTKIKNPETEIIGSGDQDLYLYSGFIAEYAFAKSCNGIWDNSISVRKGGIDVVMPNGIKCDVKSTQVPNGKLTTPHDNEEVDIYPFCIVNEDLYVTWIYGYAWRSELISEKCKNAFQNRPGYWMDKEDLHHFKSFGSTIYEL